MATADELLSSEVCDKVLTVDLDNRVIVIPKSVTCIGVESDDAVEFLHFRVPRNYCNVDLSEFAIRINYLNAKGGGDMYEVNNAVVSDNLIEFDWIVGRNAVTYKGNVTFNLCLKDVNEAGEVVREFNTTTATLPVLPGLETGEMIIQEHADILEQWKLDLFGTGDTVEQRIKDAGDEAIADLSDSIKTYVSENEEELRGPRGYVFTPSVDENGNISWSNDGGLVNPETRNIKGEPGEAFTYDMFTDEQLKALTGPSGVSIDTIERTSGTGAAGTTDTYTIKLTDGRTSTFTVYNGANGTGAGDMLSSVYDPQGKNTDVFAYVDDAIGDINAILDSINGE